MNPCEQTLNSQNPRPQAHSSGGQPRERAPGQGPLAPEEESTGAELGGPPRLLVSCRPGAAPMPRCLLLAIPRRIRERRARE